jgi:hypothetical protein
MAFLLNNFFPKKIVEKNSAMALFQSIYGILYIQKWQVIRLFAYCARTELMVLSVHIIYLCRKQFIYRISSNKRAPQALIRPKKIKNGS